nr:MAG TPA: hypothetical protein [Caudoviricetes sp.]
MEIIRLVHLMQDLQKDGISALMRLHEVKQMERLTLEEAIKYIKEVVQKNRKNKEKNTIIIPNRFISSTDCAEKYEQVAKWLEELKECQESENDNIFYQIRKKLNEDKIPENMEPFIKEYNYRSTENETVLEVKIGWREK